MKKSMIILKYIMNAKNIKCICFSFALEQMDGFKRKYLLRSTKSEIRILRAADAYII